MTIALVVAVTDRDWFAHLRGLADLDEVNFWTATTRPFRALQPGEMLLFALEGAIVGGGVFVSAATLPCSLAWDAFGEANGVPSFEAMRQRILRQRPGERDPKRNFDIGCRILSQPFFFAERQWLAVPSSFTAAAFQSYDTRRGDGARLWDDVQARLAGRDARGGGFFDEQRRYGTPMLIRPRLGQGAFRVQVTEAYRRCCAVTREKTLPALEAAHIRPFSQGGEHRPDNGMLLRRDIHSLFDLGYVSITPDLTFVVSGRIREEYDDGRDYYALHGRGIAIPNNAEWRADRTALTWHYESVFLGN